MKAHRRTEITVETDRLLIIQRRRLVRAWCQECGGEVEMVSLGEAEALTEVPGQKFCESAQAHRWHLSENQEGSYLVCLESLRKSL
ncbi:MAG: hypothetical protein WB799_15110 [Candidatus Sulfotelmatobacter sp.]